MIQKITNTFLVAAVLGVALCTTCVYASEVTGTLNSNGVQSSSSSSTGTISGTVASGGGSGSGSSTTGSSGGGGGGGGGGTNTTTPIPSTTTQSPSSGGGQVFGNTISATPDSFTGNTQGGFAGTQIANLPAGTNNQGTTTIADAGTTTNADDGIPLSAQAGGALSLGTKALWGIFILLLILLAYVGYRTFRSRDRSGKIG